MESSTASEYFLSDKTNGHLFIFVQNEIKCKTMVLVDPTSFHTRAILIESTIMWQRESNGALILLFNFLLRPYNMKRHLRNTLHHTKKHILLQNHTSVFNKGMNNYKTIPPMQVFSPDR